MRKKTLLTASMLISAGLLLGGCAGNVPQSPKDSTLQKVSTRQSEGAGSEGAGKSDPAENADPSGAINGLKHLNDTYGHATGDKLIKNACILICEIFIHGAVFRIGGDEFVVILQDKGYDSMNETISTI